MIKSVFHRGDWIKNMDCTDSQYWEISALSSEYARVTNEFELYDPIPITEETLEKFGFYLHHTGKFILKPNSKDYIFITKENGNFRCIVIIQNISGPCVNVNIKYIHEIQHCMEIAGIDADLEYKFFERRNSNTISCEKSTEYYKIYDINDLHGEKWLPICGYEGLYEVSNKGRIKSLQKRVNGAVCPCIISQRNFFGYLKVNLVKNKKRTTFFVHRLVYFTFFNEPQNYISKQKYGNDRLVINHKNEIKDDNRIENLELTTVLINNNYGTKGIRSSVSHTKKVYQYTLDKKLVKIWDGGALECHKKLGFCQGSISACCRGKSKSHHGFLWSYTEI